MNTTPRQVADAYVDALCDLDPITATAPLPERFGAWPVLAG